MSRSFFHVLLNMLPGSLSQSPDNPLQVDRLPKTGGVELDYPVYQDSPASARLQLLIIAFLASLVAPALTWSGHWIPIPFVHGGTHTIVLIAGAVLIVFGLTAPRWPAASLALTAATIPIVAFLVQEMPFALAVTIVAVASLGLLADQLATSQLFLKTTAPVSRERASCLRATWRSRWTNFFEPLKGSEFYWAGYLVLVPACWLALRAVAATNGFGNFKNTVTLFFQLALLGIAWYWLLEFLVAPFFGRPRYPLRLAAGALGRALILWCSYNRRRAKGAGVHVSPAGVCRLRQITLAGVIVTWACLWAGVQLSVPPDLSAVLQDNISIWQNTFPQVLDRTRPDTAPSDGNLDDSELFQLTPAEEEFLSRLPADEAAKQLAERRTLALQERQEAQVAAQAERSRQTAQTLLVLFLETFGRVFIRVITPSLGVLAVCWALLVPMVGRGLAAFEAEFPQSADRIYSTENWEGLVTRIRGSQDPVENQSILLGSNARDDTPILVPRDVFKEHMHILGDSGSGKTSRGILPLVAQLMRFDDSSVIVLDLKADNQSVFETLSQEAAACHKRLKKKNGPDHPGYPFRWFTTVLDRSSFVFNPLTQRVMPRLDPDQKTDVLTAALGLQYGSDYGRKYFGDANFDVLNYAIRENPHVQSLAELAEILDGAEYFPLPKKTKEAAGNVQSSVRRLSRFKALNACPSEGSPQAVLDHAIDLDDLFTTPQALYVALPSAAGVSNTAEIARIFLYCLLATAQAHGPGRTQVFLVVDEFQRIVAKNVELFLQTARSMNIGCIFANQSLADLNAIGADLIPAVQTNCRVRQIFGAGHYDDIVDILGTSGEALYAMRNWRISPWGSWSSLVGSMTIAETRGTRISINDVLLATDAPGRNITYIRRGDGYAQFGGMPFLMDSAHHIAEPTFKDHVKKAWPAADERMVVSTLADSIRPSPPGGNILGEPVPDPGEIIQGSRATPEEEPSDDSDEEPWGIIDAEYAEQEAARKANRRRRRLPPS